MSEKKQAIFKALENIIDFFDKEFAEYEGDDLLSDALAKAYQNNQFPAHSVDAGASKAVILLKGEDFVIKIPFDSQVVESYIDEDEDEEAEETESTPVYDRYFGASELIEVEREWDYCEAEMRLYQEAVEEGLGAYFAEEDCIGFIQGRPIYWQTRCTPMNTMEIDYHSQAIKAKTENSEQLCEQMRVRCFNALWIADFIECYGQEEFERLSDFIARWCIDDLRACNIGYLDGAPIIFDYSGFNEW